MKRKLKKDKRHITIHYTVDRQKSVCGRSASKGHPIVFAQHMFFVNCRTCLKSYFK